LSATWRAADGRMSREPGWAPTCGSIPAFCIAGIRVAYIQIQTISVQTISARTGVSSEVMDPPSKVGRRYLRIIRIDKRISIPIVPISCERLSIMNGFPNDSPALVPDGPLDRSIVYHTDGRRQGRRPALSVARCHRYRAGVRPRNRAGFHLGVRQAGDVLQCDRGRD